MIAFASAAVAVMALLVLAVALLRGRTATAPSSRRRATVGRLWRRRLSVAEIARTAGMAQDAVRAALALGSQPTFAERVGSFFRRGHAGPRDAEFNVDAAKALWL
jgi:hypothetical protein